MADLQTRYLGIALKNPIIVGACEMTAHLGSIQKLEKAGAGAIVIKSLFEEQVQLERFKLDDEHERYAERHAEMISLYPRMEHSGPQEHLMWVKKAKEAVTIPVIASLNAVNRSTWLEYAARLQATGVDGLELNFYAVPREADQPGAAIEDEQVAIADEVVKAVSIPVSVKLSPFYTNPVHLITRLDQVGVKGIVLFNRLLEPDIDVEQESSVLPFNLSTELDYRLPLRYAGLLSGQLSGEICGSTGLYRGTDIAKMLLAGAQCVQVVSALYKHNIDYLRTLLTELTAWMDAKGYASLDDFRGKLSKQRSADPWAYERAQYVKLLFESEELLTNSPLP